MEKKINIAELLKDCPKGMELDCTSYDNVSFDKISDDKKATYPIFCYITDKEGNRSSISFTENGCESKRYGAKCVIFPKGKTTWEGFERPFKDGDILTYTSNYTTTFIYRNKDNEPNFSTSFYVACNNAPTHNFLIYNKNTLIALNKNCDVRLATEEETQKLFDAIKENGYKWNEENKTLEKLIVPKFKVGDNWSAGYVVETDNLQPYKEETMEIPEKLIPKIDFNEYCKDKYILDLGNYEIKEENGKTYAVRKWLEYPKTYLECCDVLGRTLPINDDVEGYKWELIMNFQRLLVCRDAYWKIAGEQMGLGKPWKPSANDEGDTYLLCYNRDSDCFDKISGLYESNAILDFPAKEMRDAFFENFKDLIEQCKEFL